jgi:DNA polymerase
VNREEAVLREFNLYPLWKQRHASAPLETLIPVKTGIPDATKLRVEATQPVETSRPVVAVEMAVTLPAQPQSLISPISNSVEKAPAKPAWQELKQQVRKCTACKLRSGCTQTVFGVGDEAADWLFVGEGPGADEDTLGEPFVGQAGKLLDNMLLAIRQKRGNNVYIANIVKCRPPGNRTPEKNEVATCLPYLQQQIELIAPKIIVALGKTAANALLGTEATLTSLRGRLHNYNGIPLVITYHPAYLLRVPAEKKHAWQDLCLAVKTMEG